MAIRVANLRLGLDEPEAAVAAHLAKVLHLPADEIRFWRILRKSLDARVKEDLCFVYSAEVRLTEEAERRALSSRKSIGEVRIDRYEETPFTLPAPGSAPLRHRPIIIGSGPAGLVAGFFLAQQGYLPLIIERGPAVHQRIRDVQGFDAGGTLNSESNYLFGEGGAGTFSDGKLTCRSTGPEVRRVMELFAECKGKPSILYDYRPHLGSNRLPAVVKALRRRIEAYGGEIRFECRIEDLELADGQVRGVATTDEKIAADVVILAIGHSARDTLTMLARRGVPMVPKPFQMGVRLEQPQEIVNRIKYGKTPLEEKLGAADYNLVARGPSDLFTFCMCAGGYIIASVSEPGYFCTNGMSLSGRDSPFANSGLVITVPVSAFPGPDLLAGVRLQQEYERRAFEVGRGNYLCPIQNARDFLANRATDRLPPCSYQRGVVLARIEDLVPPLIAKALRHGLPILDHRWHGRYLTQATLVAPESRGSSPVRMVRDDHSRQSPGWAGLYPVGEGAGYAGGIVSAAVDGLRTAMAIIAQFAPLRKA